MARMNQMWSKKQLHLVVNNSKVTGKATEIFIPYPWRASRSYIGGREVAVTREPVPEALMLLWGMTPESAERWWLEVTQRPLIGNELLRTLFSHTLFSVTEVETGCAVMRRAGRNTKDALRAANARVEHFAKKHDNSVHAEMTRVVERHKETVNPVYFTDWLAERVKEGEDAAS